MKKSESYKRTDAEVRAVIHRKRSLKEQLQELDRRLGKGKGAMKERAYLSSRIEYEELTT